ncbi:MAG: FkbM family methyltransferase [Candidatus Omnitrophica bacterium]|nr:FkbM family methyltransferase [Candidatus Omnitrophota bacterium]
MKTSLLSSLQNVRDFFMRTGLGKFIPFRYAIYEFFIKALWSGKNEIEIQGSKMYVDVFHPDPAMRNTFRAYAFHRVHEECTTALFQKIVKPGFTVLDLGANIGYFSLLAAKLVGEKGKVYSFEPEPRNYGFLRKNLELNGYKQATAFQKAVGEQTGTVKLYICHYDTGHHTIQQYDGIQSYNPQFVAEKKDFVEIEKVRLDDFFKDKLRPVNVIKMDVEGAELLALTGMENLIKANDHLVMFIEFFPLLITKMGQSPEEFARRLLEEFHFKMFVVEHDYSMADKAAQNNLRQVHHVAELMQLCTGWKDHINLFLEKP